MRTAPAQSPARVAQRDLRMRRAMAFTGVAPLGAFVLVHVIVTATALGGSARFARIFANPSPVLTMLVLAFVLLPLAFHAGYGAFLAASSKTPLGVPSFAPRLRRAAALGTLAFLAYHLVTTSGRVWVGELRPEALYNLLTADLSSTWYGFPLRAVLTILGLAATAFHMAVSLWTFCATWGVTLRPRALRACAWACAALGVLVFGAGANTIVYFATGSRLIGPRHVVVQDGVLPHSPCPQTESK